MFICTTYQQVYDTGIILRSYDESSTGRYVKYYVCPAAGTIVATARPTKVPAGRSYYFNSQGVLFISNITTCTVHRVLIPGTCIPVSLYGVHEVKCIHR